METNPMTNDNNMKQDQVVETQDIETPEMEIARLRAENAKLQAKAEGHASIQLSETTPGVISFYGLGRFPTSLRRNQWMKIIKAVENGELQKVLEANKNFLDKCDNDFQQAKAAKKQVKAA
jgi:hypothetical protein